jgi:hypothetical protein
MALSDALLLDPAPFNFWLAARTDGIKGSGYTPNDPYNATPSRKITLVNNGMTATASLAAGHGLQNGESVVISGVTGPSENLWNGTFAISNVGPTSFQYTMSSSPSWPATGTIVMAKVSAATTFDELMDGLPANSQVHLGAGTFLTHGYAEDVNGGCQPKAGMKIRGSGVGVTRLQLVNATVADKHYFAIGHVLGTGSNPVQPNRVDYCEVSDLTIDCGLASNGSAACGAVRLMGHHCRSGGPHCLDHWTQNLSCCFSRLLGFVVACSLLCV